MVKKRNKHIRKNGISKGSQANCSKAREIKASTGYGTCTEQLSPFGGLLALIKFLNLVKFKEIFDHIAIKDPNGTPILAIIEWLWGF